jgi:hypothetical protein
MIQASPYLRGRISFERKNGLEFLRLVFLNYYVFLGFNSAFIIIFQGFALILHEIPKYNA